MPAAPLRFSITTGCFHLSVSLVATVRAEMSVPPPGGNGTIQVTGDRKSTRLNSSHTVISYAVFCLKKKWQTATAGRQRRLRDSRYAYKRTNTDHRRQGHQDD